MVPVLNHLGVHCAVYGNHDFGVKMFMLNILYCSNIFMYRFWFGNTGRSGVTDVIPLVDDQRGGQRDG